MNPKFLSLAKVVGIGINHFLLLGISLYCVWGWVTVNDIRKICAQRNLDFEQVAPGLAPDYHVKSDLMSDPPTVALTPKGPPGDIDRYLVPYKSAQAFKLGEDGNEVGTKVMWGAVLEPFVNVTENTSNALTAFSFGFMISLLLVGIESLKETAKRPVTLKRIFLRPWIGAFSAMLVFLIILSGGSLIWNQASGVSGLSLGVISYVGAIYCEKFKAISSVTT